MRILLPVLSTFTSIVARLWLIIFRHLNFHALLTERRDELLANDGLVAKVEERELGKGSEVSLEDVLVADKAKALEVRQVSNLLAWKRKRR